MSRPPLSPCPRRLSACDGVAATREPGQEIRLPAPRVGIATVHEQDRRVSRRRRGQARAHLELRFGGKHAGVDKRGACYDFLTTSRHDRRESTHSAREPARSRATTRRAAVARGSRRSSISCAKRTPAIGASRCRRSAIRRHAWSSSDWRRACMAPTRVGGRSPATMRGSCSTRRCTRTDGRTSRSAPRSATGSTLIGCRITNAVKCLPPQNKPLPVEIANCNSYLAADLATLPRGGGGPRARPHRARSDRFAHSASSRGDHVFAHGAKHRLDTPAPGVALFDSYHCSRYNTNTGTIDARDVPFGVRCDRAPPRDDAKGRGMTQGLPSVQSHVSGSGRAGAGRRRSTRASS